MSNFVRDADKLNSAKVPLDITLHFIHTSIFVFIPANMFFGLQVYVTFDSL